LLGTGSIGFSAPRLKCLTSYPGLGTQLLGLYPSLLLTANISLHHLGCAVVTGPTDRGDITLPRFQRTQVLKLRSRTERSGSSLLCLKLIQLTLIILFRLRYLGLDTSLIHVVFDRGATKE
jgi:hypothetical protein